MGYYMKLEGAPLTAYRELVEALKTRAKTELKLGDDGIVLRPIRPEDIGLTTPEFTFNISSGTAWNTMIDNKSIADNRFVGINGVIYAKSGEQAVSQLRVTRMGQKKRYWQVQGINYLESPVVFFDDPIIIDQNTTITVEGYGVSTGSTEKIIFLGAVAEKKGVLIQ